MISPVAMDWFRNLVKSHVQKRLEQRQLEVDMQRESRHSAGPPPRPNPLYEPESNRGKLHRVA